MLYHERLVHPQTRCKRPTALIRQKLTVSQKKKNEKKISKIVVFCYDDIVNERDYCRDFYQDGK